MENPYEVLGLQQNCTDEEIIKAFRKAALKWHPDKNPERKIESQEMFLKISKAFALLSDAAARAAYDHVEAAKAARAYYVKQRQQNESEKRRRLREELEEREARFAKAEEEKYAKEMLQKEVERLRKEGSKLLEKERENIEREIHRRSAAQCSTQDTLGRLKLKWKRGAHNDYSKELISQIFSKHGDVEHVVLSPGGKCTAVVEMKNIKDTDAVAKEIGKEECPLTVKWLLKPEPTIVSEREAQEKPKARPMTAAEFADFEAEVLFKMMSNEGGLTSKNSSKFDEL